MCYIDLCGMLHVFPFNKGGLRGPRLEWMDAASCLAAERHCGRSAVTLVMDDLDFKDPLIHMIYA